MFSGCYIINYDIFAQNYNISHVTFRYPFKPYSKVFGNSEDNTSISRVIELLLNTVAFSLRDKSQVKTLLEGVEN